MPAVTTVGFHHVAFACRDLAATDRFYTELVGLSLVHTEIHRRGDGFFRHVFYDLGDRTYLAFFDVHDVGERADWSAGISTGLGLPVWVNHVALQADRTRQEAVRERMTAAGIDLLMERDHGWCHSLYYLDPNGIMVELCRDTPGFRPDPHQARSLLGEVPAA